MANFEAFELEVGWRTLNIYIFLNSFLVNIQEKKNGEKKYQTEITTSECIW